MLPLLCVFILLPAVATQESVPDAAPSCPKEVSIRGGTVSVSDGYRPGSLLTYSCPTGSYPYPSRSRICQSSGMWSPMRSPTGGLIRQAQCRDIRCPAQQAFENGFFSPRRSWHPVGAVLSFECSDGYQLHGSAQRYCQPNGRWNGTSPVCEDGAGHCPSLAIPPGAIASGGRNHLGDRITFQCQRDLDLVGSSQRVCTPEGEWSGAEPSCRAPFSYDRAEDVEAEFGASFTNVLSAVSSSGPDPSGTLQAPSLGRRLILSRESFLYVYLLLDASHSVTLDNFKIFTQCAQIIINRIASFDVPIRFSVISYASQPKTIVHINDDIAEDPDEVLDKMAKDMKYKDHGNATGTNIQAALTAVYEMMVSHEAAAKHPWNRIRHAIILLTDGKSNMGGSPRNAVVRIEELLDVRENRKDYLDIYAFGIGNLDVDWNDMNEIASKKPGERHTFILKSSEELKKAFEDVLDPKDLDDICGLANNSDSARWDQKNPWHVALQENTQLEPSCRGALISKTWVLTAAHCFNQLNNTSGWKVILGGGTRQIKRRIDHELYNVRAKVAKGIKEFYDYDISLLELESPVQFGGKVRPICVPCTEGANKALKKPPTTTCKDHELELLSSEKMPAEFIALDNKRKEVQIRTKTSRPLCISGAVQKDMIYSNVSDVSEVVTERFLCSGQDKMKEEATCKGESGGSLFVEKRERYVQVGVISWGTFDPCEKKKKNRDTGEVIRDRPPRGHKPRDFYISLFGVQDWLRRHLSGSLKFIPKQYSSGVTYGTCDPKGAEILGGQYTLLENGTVLKYECPDRQYPYPTEYRFCHNKREWSPMRNTRQRLISKAVCRDIRCSRPIEFEHGEYEPRQPYYNISQELRFECYQGYTLRGSQNRTCLPNGKWSGDTTICDDGAGHCPSPGVPIGARKAGTHYQIGYQVKYNCDNGLSLMGSKERICQESGAWSGSEPECRSPYTYDTPEEVANQFISSLTEVAESSDPNKVISDTEKRKIKIEADGTLNVYIVLDASRSIGKKDFKDSKEVVVTLIEKLSSYDVAINYGIITFATHAKEILSTTDPMSHNAAWVIERLENITYSEHKLKPGTNIHRGLTAVYEMMVNQEMKEKKDGQNPAPVATSTRHVIILLSDGDYNMGGTPVPVIRKIRDFLSIGHPLKPREDYLDVYVFGVGSLVNTDNMNELASKKTGETHSFKLKDIKDLQEAFDNMIDENEVFSMCGLAKEFKGADDQEKNPWHVNIHIRRSGSGYEHCKGALVSKYFVLTAAHCFTIDDKAEQISVRIGKESFDVVGLRSHPKYSIGKLQAHGIPEFYDYDIALVNLSREVKFRPAARPVCLPCTAGTTRALRKPHPQTTCRDHEQELLPVGNVPSFFVTSCEHSNALGPGLRRSNVKIKTGEKKSACEEDARKAKYYKNVTDISQVVTDRFLCTGGIDPEVDPNTCKGDSGGPLLVDKRHRYIQVGVISWGVEDVCRNKRLPKCQSDNAFQQQSPSHARDFHINIFKVLPWLREELRDEGLDFLP
ncbi:complement factor B [Hemicordylus capensis]|uniref:complement factor B n=1 Tax=Hemicordylus capensis TaxID=884348 RepID=UPI002304684F|nr:complement factor B [Hemicordylus capensis]